MNYLMIKIIIIFVITIILFHSVKSKLVEDKMLNAAGSVGRRLLEVQDQLGSVMDERRHLTEVIESLRFALNDKGEV